MFDIENYGYELPQDLIAQTPAPRRDASRLLVVDRSRKAFGEARFKDLADYLEPDDLLVVNDTKVVPARIWGRKPSGGRVEVLVLDFDTLPQGVSTVRRCLLKSSKRPKAGTRVRFESGVSGKILDFEKNGLARVRFEGDIPIDAFLRQRGDIPLPPYIKRDTPGDQTLLDRERYQTIFSNNTGAVAAPTAGLHFTSDLVRDLEEKGISVSPLTLHVGYGTFRPVRTQDIRRHRLDEESFRIDRHAARAINDAKAGGGRLIAVGTTVVRALETAAGDGGAVAPQEGKTDLLITPGYSFKLIDGLVTNFHLPKSSLLFLVAAFAGLDLIKQAYAFAIEKKYRFYSYGDAMLIL